MSDIDIYGQLAARHGHYCPMSTLGLRIGLEVVRRLSDAESAGWQFCYQSRTCAVDGIGLALKNNSLAGALQVEQQGQHLLHCKSAHGRELSLCLSAEALQLAAQYRELDEPAQLKHLEVLRHIAFERIINVTELSG